MTCLFSVTPLQSFTTGQPRLMMVASAGLVATSTEGVSRTWARCCSIVASRWVFPLPDGPTISRCSGWGLFGSARPQVAANSGPSSDQGMRSGVVKEESRRQSLGGCRVGLAGAVGGKVHTSARLLESLTLRSQRDPLRHMMRNDRLDHRPHGNPQLRPQDERRALGEP